MQFFESLPLDLHYCLIVGGVVVIVVALLLYFLPLRGMKIPGILACSLGALALGTGLGIAAMIGLGYHWEREGVTRTAATNGSDEGTTKGFFMSKGGTAKGGGMQKGGGLGKGGGTPKGAGGQAPSSKSQLASLVAKLDLLTGKALTVDLTQGQKTKVAEQLKGLEEGKELSEEEAKRRLDALLDVLKSHKETFEAAGYRWPGQTGGGPRPAAGAGNPFQEKDNAQHLKSLQGRL